MDYQKRILHITTMNRAGQETFIMNLYRHIDTKKLQFDFLMYTLDECDYDAEIKELGGMIYKIPFRNNRYIHNMAIILSFLKSHSEYDTVHIHTDHARSAFSVFLCRIAGVKRIIVHSHNSNSNTRYLHFLCRPFLRFFSTDYCACSKAAAQWMFGYKLIAKGKVNIINNAIDTKKFVFNERIRDKNRKELKIDNKLVIGHIGRFDYQKNHTFLIDIFKEIHVKNEDTVLMLVGKGELEANIRAKVERLGLSNSVIFSGIRTDIPDLLQMMDVFLFPSHFEGLGIVLVEAQATGLQCVISDVVPDEAVITDLVKKVSLKQPVTYWADRVLAFDNGYERKNICEKVINAGYDVKSIAKWFEDFYTL